jgi:hypothetical protein
MVTSIQRKNSIIVICYSLLERKHHLVYYINSKIYFLQLKFKGPLTING